MDLYAFSKACGEYVFHSCVEAQKINVDSVPQSCGGACVHFHRHVGSVFHSCVESLCVFPQACGSVFHNCVEVLCVFLQVVCVPQSCGGAYVHFHRHVGSVCSTVVWRLSVNFNKNMDSVFHSHVEGLCAFPRASGKCTFNSHMEALCEFS